MREGSHCDVRKVGRLCGREGSQCDDGKVGCDWKRVPAAILGR